MDVFEVVFSVTSKTESRKWFKFLRNELGDPSRKPITIDEPDEIRVSRRSVAEWNSSLHSVADIDFSEGTTMDRVLYSNVSEDAGGRLKWSFKKLNMRDYQQHPILLVLGENLYAFGCTELVLDEGSLKVQILRTDKRWDNCSPHGHSLSLNGIIAYAVDYDKRDDAIFWLMDLTKVIGAWRYSALSHTFEKEHGSLPPTTVPESFSNIIIGGHLFIYHKNEILGCKVGIPVQNKKNLLKITVQGPWEKGSVHLMKVGQERIAFVAMDNSCQICCQYFEVNPDSRLLKRVGSIHVTCDSGCKLETVFLKTYEMTPVAPRISSASSVLEAAMVVKENDVSESAQVSFVQEAAMVVKENEISESAQEVTCFTWLYSDLICTTGSDAWKVSNLPVVISSLKSLSTLISEGTKKFWDTSTRGERFSDFFKNMLRCIVRILGYFGGQRRTVFELSTRLIFFAVTDGDKHYPKILLREGPPLRTATLAQDRNFSKIGDLIGDIIAQFSVKPHPEVDEFIKYLSKSNLSYLDIYEHPAMWRPGEGIEYLSEVHRNRTGPIIVSDYQHVYGEWTTKPVAKISFIKDRIDHKTSSGLSSYVDTMDSLVSCVRDVEWHAYYPLTDVQETLEKEYPCLFCHVFWVKGRMGRARYIEGGYPS